MRKRVVWTSEKEQCQGHFLQMYFQTDEHILLCMHFHIAEQRQDSQRGKDLEK